MITIPYVNLALQHRAMKNEILEAVERVLDHGQFILGPEVETFEVQFAEYTGAHYAIGVDNGTSALILVLRAFGIGDGDEVITAPNSFLASASSISIVGARPIFVDVRDDFNIDPNLIEDAITSRTKAIIPVHLTGRPADIFPITEIARKHNLFVIEDCAQAIGARYHGQHVGTFGDAGCFSLHPLKTLNALGDGGMIVTADRELADALRKARNHGLSSRDECEFWSYNNRLDAIHAAILQVKMKHIDHWSEERRSKAAIYRKHLKNIVQVPTEMEHEYAVYHTFIVQADKRDHMMDYLAKNGIETKIHYPIPIHLQNAAKELGYEKGSFRIAERQAERILSLPIYPELQREQLEYVASNIVSFYRG